MSLFRELCENVLNELKVDEKELLRNTIHNKVLEGYYKKLDELADKEAFRQYQIHKNRFEDPNIAYKKLNEDQRNYVYYLAWNEILEQYMLNDLYSIIPTEDTKIRDYILSKINEIDDHRYWGNTGELF